MRKVISLMEKDTLRSQIRNTEIPKTCEGFIGDRVHAENASRLEMFSQSVVRHRPSEFLTVAIRLNFLLTITSYCVDPIKAGQLIISLIVSLT